MGAGITPSLDPPLVVNIEQLCSGDRSLTITVNGKSNVSWMAKEKLLSDVMQFAGQNNCTMSTGRRRR